MLKTPQLNVLFIHQNFPGQFRHLAIDLAQDGLHRIAAICQHYAPGLSGLKNFIRVDYTQSAKPTSQHPNLRQLEQHMLNGQATLKALNLLKENGFSPDVVIAHPAWGEALYIKDVLPKVPLVNFCEFFYRSHGADVGFDPEFPNAADSAQQTRNRNALHLMNLDACDVGVAPTYWQKSVFPTEYQSKIRLIHEGVRVKHLFPNPDAVFTLPTGQQLRCGDEVVTYVARNLEPYRGFHIFMRSIKEICERRPNCQIVIVGGDHVSYGNKLPEGQTWRERMIRETQPDLSRVHFMGLLPYEQYISLLQVSAAHVYLTYPFVLSWSMLEAMACGCLLIASNTRPVREIIQEDKNGLLVDFFSSQEIAQKVDDVLSNPSDYQDIRLQARATVLSKYNIKQGIYGYRQLIKSLTT